MSAAAEVRKGLLALALVALAPAVAAAQQQPSQPGWPQPVENDLRFGLAMLDQNEVRSGSAADTYRWDGEAWYGGNLDRAWLRSEGNLDTRTGALDEAELQALYARAITSFFDLQAGARWDLDPGPSRGWATVGIEGLAPQFWEIGAAGFAGDRGRFAARLEGSYDLQITERLVLQPQFELNFYSKSDPSRGLGTGLTDLDAGLRLRYEIRRQLAPYVGVAHERTFGSTADLARRAGATADLTRLVAGLRAWY